MRADGHREVLGCAVGDNETETFWTEFLTSLRDRGLHGVQLVVSDAHRGLVAAIERTVQGAAWQRCRVHFMRNALAKASKADGPMIGAWIRTIFAQATPDAVRDQLETVADSLHESHSAIAIMLREAKADLTAFADFPHAHWPKIWSTNPIERLNKELKRRTYVVGIFPNTAALLRLSAAVLIEHHDEWQDTNRRYLSEGSMQLLFPTEPIPLPVTSPTSQHPTRSRQIATA